MDFAERVRTILSKNGQIMLEDTSDLVLCKPRLIPLKSFTLEKLEKMQQEAQKAQQEKKTTNSQ